MVTANVRHVPGEASATWIRIVTVATGIGILVARPAIITAVGWSASVVVAVFGAVLALGLAPPGSHRAVRSLGSGRVMGVFLAGTLVFLTGRVLAAGHPPAPATGLLIALNTFAAISEEAFFRRLIYEALLPVGSVAAIGGSALLFGLAHVTVYGWWAFPLDVAAGIILGWQRWASGSWAIPAATHALADLLVVI
jgi:membrane protease YdiL (CAAX protease family)